MHTNKTMQMYINIDINLAILRYRWVSKSVIATSLIDLGKTVLTFLLQCFNLKVVIWVDVASDLKALGKEDFFISLACYACTIFSLLCLEGKHLTCLKLLAKSIGDLTENFWDLRFHRQTCLSTANQTRFPLNMVRRVLHTDCWQNAACNCLEKNSVSLQSFIACLIKYCC